jgi:hypothetical protein
MQHGVIWSTCPSRQSLAMSMSSFASNIKRSATSLTVRPCCRYDLCTTKEVAERFVLLAYDGMDLARDWRDVQVDHITPCCKSGPLIRPSVQAG